MANLRLRRSKKALLDAIRARNKGTSTEKRLQQALALNPGKRDAEKGLEQTTRKYMQDKLFHDQQQQEETGHTTCDIWITASFVNYSCLRNRHRSCIDDILIVRAGGDLGAGTELDFSHVLLEETLSYKETQKSLSGWELIYRCELTLWNEVHPAVATCVSEIYQALSERHVVKSKAYSLELTVKGLETLDFNIFAYPSTKASGRPVLEIKERGHVNESLLIVILVMYPDYLKVAP
ncbi:hypothetical protein CSHISOI_00680, partial [Colletotrichum shisoi]